MLLNYSNCILVLFVPAWNIALISGVLPLILLFLIGLNHRRSAWLVIPPWPRLLTLCLFGARWLHYLSSTAITLVTALMNWPPVFHLQWLSHIPHVRQHLPTTIVWNSPMRELIGSVMVSSLLLPTFGTLLPSSAFPAFLQPFLPSKGRSITTLGTRWHDFFMTLFRYFINLFYSFPFLDGYRLEKGHIVPVLCTHSYIYIYIYKKKKTGDIQALELLQRSYLRCINGMQGLNYWEQLGELKLFSLERCRERYIAIYICTFLRAMFPILIWPRFPSSGTQNVAEIVSSPECQAQPHHLFREFVTVLYL